MDGPSSSESQIEQQRTRAALLIQEEILANRILNKMRLILQEVSKRQDHGMTPEETEMVAKQNDQLMERLHLIKDVSDFDKRWAKLKPKTLAEVINPYTDHILRLILFFKQLQQEQHDGENFVNLRDRYPYALSTGIRQACLRTELIERALLLLNPHFDLGGGTLPERFMKIGRAMTEFTTSSCTASESECGSKESQKDEETDEPHENGQVDKAKAEEAVVKFLDLIGERVPNFMEALEEEFRNAMPEATPDH
uniref:Uncharacterized protein n=1 Tax=Panagrolaimus sp. JU765 TaxID=591449 RepID=A0AC34QVD9_9BILA